MFNLQKLKKDKKGFTLVELIVVLVIIAVLAAIAIPAMTGYIDKSKEKTAISEARTFLVGAQTVASDRYGAGMAIADIPGYIESKIADVNALSGMSTTLTTGTLTVDSHAKIETFTIVTGDGAKQVVYKAAPDTANGEEMFTVTDATP
jgi:type IV pilus assembly protein PilA